MISDGFSECLFGTFTSPTGFTVSLVFLSGNDALKLEKNPAGREAFSSLLILPFFDDFWYVPEADDSLSRLSFLPSVPFPPPL